MDIYAFQDELLQETWICSQSTTNLQQKKSASSDEHTSIKIFENFQLKAKRRQKLMYFGWEILGFGYVSKSLVPPSPAVKVHIISYTPPLLFFDIILAQSLKQFVDRFKPWFGSVLLQPILAFEADRTT